jgi:urease accessory protein
MTQMNLRLLQLGDSALPIGGYSHSWGLEAAVARGLVRGPVDLEQWTRDWLRFAVAPLEGVVVAEVCRSATADDWRTVARANDVLRASLAPLTLRLSSRDMGEQLLALAENWAWSIEQVAALRRLNSAEWHHAPVFATLTAAAGASAEEAVLVYLHQAALGAIGAGVRAIPIGHTHGQQVLARLHADLLGLARQATARDLEAAGSFCPAHEVLCHAQARLYTRLFRS